ncbi:ATP-dependent RNA helicase dbp3 [Penicillium cosmopolitanum]|uniref:RNA helicase n=1 Tax=Penicillium cosmopolitanum TaxID=1131564 RepID=A0A9X0B3Z0_9EURO|nr:ATP-dependent RNA helicase dbp3 [Penicillium cosmopolitanum]KAJ5387289.1 ATP-dependent RNA helicase dbp3 [Penicillium cosmopolitanum]
MGKRSHDSAELKPKKKSKSDKPLKEKKSKSDKIEKTEKVVAEQENGTSSSDSSTYTQASALTALPQSQIDTFMSEHVIKFTDPSADAPAYRPLTSFDYLPPCDNSNLYAPLKSFPAPTPIQACTWPLLFAGRDVIGIAETGSGKTLAFGLPCLRKLTQSKKSNKPYHPSAVIISPTRELAMQIYDQLIKYTEVTDVGVVCIFGGVSKDEQRTALKTAAIVVATPGRLKDLQQDGSVDLSKVKYLVLDEADRMLDKGFEQDIKDIVAPMPVSRRQTVMFTATWPRSVRDLANTFMSSPVTVTIGGDPSADPRANLRIKQDVEVMDGRDKENRLIQLLTKSQKGKNPEKVLVFCLYKKEAMRVERLISQRGFKVAGIHGDLNQSDRFRNLDAFKSGAATVLVATDVAARGLDIPAVMLVINVTFPLTVEDYVHRIGRTGRAGKEGHAITMFTEQDKGLSGGLVNVLKAAKQNVPEDLLKFGTTVKKKQHDAYGAFFKDVDSDKKATKITFDD